MNEIEARGKIKYRIAMAMSLVGAGEDGKAYEDLEIAIQALKEIREYRELGTVEEFHKLKTLFGDENVEVSEITTKILKEYPKYKSIGTVEELQALKEKNEPKKPDYEGDGYYNGQLVLDTWICPNCEKHYEVDYDDYDFCPNCGQHIDHSGLTEDD